VSQKRTTLSEGEHGIAIRVESAFMPEHSSASDGRFAFSYTVTIENQGSEPATLLARHWVITDGHNKAEHVRGPGVVGHQPTLPPGQSFAYTSGAILKTHLGTMTGEYLMQRADGSRFEAEIPPFALVVPDAVQ